MPVDYHAWTHRPKALGGTDPIDVSGGTSAALLTSLDFVTDPSDLVIPADTWVQIAAPGVGRKFMQGWDLDGDWTLNGDTGQIQRLEYALYVGYLSVAFTDADPGDTCGVAIRYLASGGYFHINSTVALHDDWRVNVAAPFWGTLTTPADAYVYSSAALTLGLTDFHMRRFELGDDGTEHDFS